MKLMQKRYRVMRAVWLVAVISLVGSMIAIARCAELGPSPYCIQHQDDPNCQRIARNLHCYYHPQDESCQKQAAEQKARRLKMGKALDAALENKWKKVGNDPSRNRLEQKVRLPSFLMRCEIALQMSHSLPLPVHDASPKSYRVYYYMGATPGRPGPSGSKAFPSLVSAVSAEVPAQGLLPIRCESVQIKVSPNQTRPQAAQTGATFGQTSMLYDLTEKVGDLYFKDAPKTAESSQLVGQYFDLFSRHMSPGLEDLYYRTNPDFWAWVEKQTGKSLQPPKEASETK